MKLIRKDYSVEGTTTRSRPLYFPSGNTDTTITIPPFGTGIPAVTKGVYTVVGGQKTTSTNTIWPYLKKARSLYHGTRLTFRNVDVGSNFYTSKLYVSEPEEVHLIRYHNAYTTSECSGNAYAYSGNTQEFSPLPALSISETQNLMAYGTTAIARCIPTNPVSGLANFLGELRRDGLPLVPGQNTQSAFQQGQSLKKGSASDYLNWEFAIRPTLNDLTKFAHVVKHHDKVLKQYLRDSGKNIKRRYSFPEEREVTSSTISTNYVPFGIPSKYFVGSSRGVLTKEVVTTTNRWFTGEFCYYLSLDDNLLGSLQAYEQKANKLLGVRLNPELAWNLTPWSWGVDWFSNAGDVFHNVSAFLADGLVMRRAYVMEHKTITTTYKLVVNANSKPTGGESDVYGRIFTQVFTQERKTRVRASPFGFGKLVTDLSPRQLAIIGALGISRSPGRAK